MSKKILKQESAICFGDHLWRRIPSDGVVTVHRFQCEGCGLWGWRSIKGHRWNSPIKIYKSGQPASLTKEKSVNVQPRSYLKYGYGTDGFEDLDSDREEDDILD